MAELNFGLLTPPGSQSIGNAFISGMDQAAVARAQENQNALSQYTLSKAKREDELTNRMLAGLQGADTIEQQAAVLRSVGRVKEANDLITSGLERKYKLGQIEAQAPQLQLVQSNLIDKALDRYKSEVPRIQTPDEVTNYVQQTYADSILGPYAAKLKPLDQAIEENVAQFTANPDKWRAMHTNVSGLQILQATMPKPQVAGGNIVNMNPVAGPVGAPIAGAPTIPQSAVARAQADLVAAVARDAPPAEIAALTAAVNAPLVGQQQGAQRNQIARAQLENETATGKFTPDTIDFLAQTYIQTGNIPPLGMGRAAADLRQKVIARAAILARTPATAALGEAAPTPISAADAARTIGQNKQAFAGGTAGQRTLGTTLANVTSAATEANNMIPLVEKYAALVNPTDFPLVNAAGNFVSRQGGGENVVGLAGSLNSLVNAYARAINPKGVATVSDKNHAREIINEAMSKGQLNTALNVMRAEMESAMAAPVQVQERMRGGGKSQAPVAAATTSAAVYVETKPLPDGRVLGKKADGSVEVIK